LRVDDLITAVRVTGRLADADTDYTDARIRQELTDTLHTVFGGKIIAARSGHWLKQEDTTTTAGRTRYRLPYRASAIESVELVDQEGALYEIRGDQIVFETAPAGGSTLRVTYYVRPSLLTQEQTTGLITAKDTSALTVTVNNLPVNRVTTSTIATGDRLDIVHKNGWHELAVVNKTCTISGTTITFPAGTDLTDVEVGTVDGDYVRAADQTDWPAIQDDYHRCLADLTAAKILRSRGMREKSDALMAEAYGTEKDPGPLRLFADLVEPRVKDSRQVCVPTVGVLRGTGRRWPLATV